MRNSFASYNHLHISTIFGKLIC